MPRLLYRSRTNRWIAGVCGGLGEYFTVDASAIRLAFVLLALWQGFGVLVYLLMVLIIPDDPVREMAAEPGLPPPPPPEEDDAQRRGRVLGMGLVLVGAYLVLRHTMALQTLFANQGVGAVLILAGLLLLILRSRPR